MRILIIGAGAVGIVYGYHLWKGGARVTFFVKDKYVEQLKTSPLVVHRLHNFSRSERAEWSEYGVISTEDEVRAGDFEVAIFTTDFTALLRDDFAKKFVAWLPKTVTIIPTSSIAGDWNLFSDDILVPLDRLGYGKILFIAWQAPIPDERTTPVPPATGKNKAIGYYTPSSLLFDGPLDRVNPIINILNKGGISSAYSEGLRNDRSEFSFLPVLIGLEASNWSFATLRSQHAALVTAAVKEVAAVCFHRENKPVPAAIGWTVGPISLSIATIVAPWFIPFDIERYLAYHFTKVGEQTKLGAQQLLIDGRAANLPVGNLEKLLQLIPRMNT